MDAIRAAGLRRMVKPPYCSGKGKQCARVKEWKMKICQPLLV